MAEGNDRIAALRRKLDQERLPLVQVAAPSAQPAPPPPPPPEAIQVARAAPQSRRKRLPEQVEPIDTPPPTGPRRNVLEILLDPRTIQWLLASGGAPLVLGLIIWLAAEGLFQNKLVVAVLLGAGNAALLAGGWSLISLTRFQTAGRAITLLACLVMPLNLWFYDAQGLIPLKEGGHLWIPALVCCIIYAASARLLKDVMLVPVFVGGVTLTGLLLLGDKQIPLGCWEITAPSTMLVLLGLAFIHVERLFPVDEGPFSRKKFGLAFFWSGHTVLACGLGLLFVAQLFGGWLFDFVQPLYEHFNFTQPEVVTQLWGKWLAVLLVLAGTYAYVYSDLVVRRIGVYIFVAVFTLLWAEVLLVTIFAAFLPIPEIEIVIIALALTGLAANFVITSMKKQQKTLLRIGVPLAVFLCGLPVLFGVVLQFRGTIPIPSPLHYKLELSYVVAMLITALSCRAAAHLYRHELKTVSTMYFFGTAAATLAGAAGLLIWASEGKMPWQNQVPLLMIIPILYLIASRLYRGHTAEQPLGWVAHAATAVMLLSSVWVAFRGFALVSKDELNLLLAVFFGEAALFYGIATVTREKSLNVYFGTAAACAVVWQLLKYADVQNEWYTLAFAVTGLVLLTLYRFAVLEKYAGGLAEAAFQCGNAMLLLAFTAAVLITGTEVLLRFDQLARSVATPFASDKWQLIWMLLGMAAASLVAVVLVKHQGWRRLYVGAAIVNAAMSVLVLLTLGNLPPHQKLELAAIIIGLLLLGAGHVGWYREQEKHSDLTSIALIFGSLLVSVTLVISVLHGRFIFDPHKVDTFHWASELALLVLGLLMLASGYSCQLKATTLAGAVMTVSWVLGLVLYLRVPEKLQSTALYLMIGGGVFFGTGLLLSIYRDRLPKMPERIKRREGVFRVLTWR